LVLYIPRAEPDGCQRLVLTHATDFDEALTVIHETIGCTDVGVKPALTYKLSNATKSAGSIGLSTAADWTGCLDDVQDAEGDKPKRKAISVTISVTDQYLLSLRAKLKVKPRGAQPKGKKKLAILDLEHAQDGDDDFDEGLGIMEKEEHCLAELQAKHGRCQLCGPEKACKIDVGGIHHKLSNIQLRAWSHALALGTRNVTNSAPPNDSMFCMFFKNSKAPPSAPAPVQQPPFPFMQPYMPPMNPYAMWGMPGMPPYGNPVSPGTPTPNPQVPRASGSKALAFPSSDPPDMGAINPYPEITEFLQKLAHHNPKRHLTDYIQLFEDKDYDNINELVKYDTAKALSEAVKITEGNAGFILVEVRAVMKRVDRARKELA
ncbi:hypothetical protein C8R47DRAFT_996103, partial [Mycena vitilis]